MWFWNENPEATTAQALLLMANKHTFEIPSRSQIHLSWHLDLTATCSVTWLTLIVITTTLCCFCISFDMCKRSSCRFACSEASAGSFPAAHRPAAGWDGVCDCAGPALGHVCSEAQCHEGGGHRRAQGTFFQFLARAQAVLTLQQPVVMHAAIFRAIRALDIH